MFKKILVPVDSSSGAVKAFEVALDLGKAFSSEIEVFSAVQLPEYGATVGEVDESLKDGKTFYGRIQETLLAAAREKGVAAAGKILPGHPAEIIVAEALKIKADLIVIGYKGSSTSRFMLGDVADKVSHHAPCAVLLIR